jgi:hypothetical protein
MVGSWWLAGVVWPRTRWWSRGPVIYSGAAPMVSCGWGGSIKLAAVAPQGHDTHRARPDQAAGYDLERAG